MFIICIIVEILNLHFLNILLYIFILFYYYFIGIKDDIFGIEISI